jgi:hypothetical protein
MALYLNWHSPFGSPTLNPDHPVGGGNAQAEAQQIEITLGAAVHGGLAVRGPIRGFV